MKVIIEALPTDDSFEFNPKKPIIPVDLLSVPYRYLDLCCIASAGENRCSVKDVVEEKRHRLTRFLNMQDVEIEECFLFLSLEEMWDDILDLKWKI